MDYAQLILKVIFLLFITIIFTRLLMVVANHIGKKLGIGDFFIDLCKNILRK